MIAKQYRPWAPGQSFLLPPCPLEWLPEDDLVYFVLDVVEQLDLKAITSVYQRKDWRGARPHDPRMMTALLLYGYCVGIASSRKLEQATYRDVAFRVLTGGCHPDHTRISEFRREYLEALAELFVQGLRMCQAAGLVKLGHVALDGTKVQANASKHKAKSYERLLKSEKELEDEVAKLLAQAEGVDQHEDELHGKDKRGDELPKELARRETRLQKIREAKAGLEAESARKRAAELSEQAERAKQKAKEADEAERAKRERAAAKADDKAKEAAKKARDKAEERVAQAREQAERAADNAKTPVEKRRANQSKQRLEAAERDRDKVTPDGDPESATTSAFPENLAPAQTDGTPRPTLQRNFTDPESRIMKKGTDFVQGYNCQLAVDDEAQIIVAYQATNQSPDAEHLEPMVDEIETNCGALPEAMTADTGYWSESNAQACEDRGIDAYIATGRQKHGSTVGTDEEAPKQESESKRRMREKLRSDKGDAIYRRRKAIVEPVNGQIKEARGFRRFLLRGIAKVNGELGLICLGHNLLKLFRAAMSEKSATYDTSLAAAE
jgi:transposase